MSTYFEKYEKEVKEIAEDLDFGEKLAKAQIHLSDKIDPPPPVIQIDDKKEEWVTVFTEGNLSVIQGRAKARKSFAVAMFVASSISSEPIFRRFRGVPKKKVFYFDTEQSKFYVQQAYRRIADMSNGSGLKERLFVFGLRPYTPAERVEMIDHVFSTIKDIGFVVIDGIRDLISNINDPDESTMISSKLLKWTDKTGAHILTVLHENKADGKARGHIGSELVNKAESILKVEKLEKDPGVSKIACEMVRGIEFDPIYFRISDNTPQVISEYYEDDGTIQMPSATTVPAPF